MEKVAPFGVAIVAILFTIKDAADGICTRTGAFPGGAHRNPSPERLLISATAAEIIPANDCVCKMRKPSAGRSACQRDRPGSSRLSLR
jgi:hypothetical protein